MLHLAAAVLTSTVAAPDAFDTIAFGSCARERQAQPIWTEIIAHQPDLFLFIGDNQYADFWEKDGKMVMDLAVATAAKDTPNLRYLRKIGAIYGLESQTHAKS